MNVASPATTTAAPDVAVDDLLYLAAGELHGVSGDDAVVIGCVRGAVWVTQEGMNDDVVLQPGQSFEPRSGGKIVVQALEDATITLTSSL